MSVVAKLSPANPNAEPPSRERSVPLSSMDRRIKPRRLNPGRITAVFAVIAVLATGVFAYTRYGLDRRLSVASDRITVSTVLEQAFTEYAPVTGSIVPKDTVYLPATDGGQVTEIFIEEGAMVEAGQPLAVFTNELLTGSVLPDALANFIYDRLAGVDEDASAKATQLSRNFEMMSGAFRADALARSSREWTLTLPIEAYVGTYVSPEMGTLLIEHSDGTLRASIGQVTAAAEPFIQADSIRVTFAPPRGSVVSFEVDGRSVHAANLSGYSYSFVKQ